MARVSMTPQAVEQLEELPPTIHARVLRLMERLERWPDVSGAKPLRGQLAGRYRLRTGDYRVQFRVTGRAGSSGGTSSGGTSSGGGGNVVTVERIGHRDGFYED